MRTTSSGYSLARSKLARRDLSFFVLHPGGAKVLEALEAALEIERELTAVSWGVLRDFSNQSSASVLFVLAETLRLGSARGYGLLAAFGPGIIAELVLLRGGP